ncbi:MAG: hypothetical protein IRZ16_13675 [Myxococcaceae bacterium]|nr:hypothetical protein [Myxococcaceae bacterium]
MFDARSLATAVAVLSAGWLACGPSTSQPVRVMALVRGAGAEGAPGGRYQPTEVQIGSLSDVVTLDGAVAYLVGGAQIYVSSQDPLLSINGGVTSDEQLADIYIKQDGNPPHASYVEKDGVLWPADFHTWNMVTTYYNVEQSFLFFQDQGVDAQVLGRTRVFYFPSFTLADVSQQEQRDNALFFAPVKSLLVLPFDKLQEAPLAMNSSIVAHEYAHVVWNKLVYGGQAVPQGLTIWAQSGVATPAANLLKALDEGFADFHALAQSCRTKFGCDTRGAESSFDAATADARDMAKNDKCLDATMNNMLAGANINDFVAGGYHYEVGTVFASALYHAGNSPDDWALLSKSLLTVYPELKAEIDGNLQTPENFTPTKVVDVVLGGVTSTELQTRVCGEFLGRLKIPREELTHCPAQAQVTGDCP